MVRSMAMPCSSRASCASPATPKPSSRCATRSTTWTAESWKASRKLSARSRPSPRSRSRICAGSAAEGKIMNDDVAPRRPELVCPAGTPASLRTAVDAGADTVYCGLQNATNARNFPGLNFSPEELRKSVHYAHARGRKVLLAVNTFPPAGQLQLWKDAVGIAASVGVDAIIVADMGVAAYACREYPQLRLHLSVQAGASSPEAIRFHCEEFGIRRVVFWRTMAVAEIADIHRQIP